VTRALPVVLLLMLIAVAGCGGQPQRPEPPTPAGGAPGDEPRAKSGNPPFYEVAGRRYVVLPSAAGYSERGVASWYGPDFHGKRTATGETYDMNAMSGAHPTLPLPVWVRVTNLQNGRSVVLRLNDRGPFSKNRIIDLSRAAAEQLDMIRTGTALVEVQSLAAGTSAPAPATRPAGRFFAQAGAFAEPGNAERLAARLKEAGVASVRVAAAEVDGRRLYRVQAGPVGSVAEFDLLIDQLRAAGVDSPRLALH
jgi:rare lipoprotein A